MRPTSTKTMTKAQCRRRINEMKPDLRQLINERIEKALNSGAIKFSDFEDNYRLPKIVLYAVMKECVYQFKPFDKKYIKYGDNISLFL